MVFENFCSCHFSYQKLFPINHIEDKFTKDANFTDSSHLDSILSALSKKLIPGLNLVSTLILAPVSALAPTSRSSDELFKQFIKVYLEFHVLNQPLAERKQSLKAKVLDVYYRRLHMDYYHFCQ